MDPTSKAEEEGGGIPGGPLGCNPENLLRGGGLCIEPSSLVLYWKLGSDLVGIEVDLKWIEVRDGLGIFQYA